MKDKNDLSQLRENGPVRGLLGVLVAVVVFLAVLCAATFLVSFIME